MVSIAEPIFGAFDEDAGPWRHGDAWVGVTHHLVDAQLRLGSGEASIPNPWLFDQRLKPSERPPRS